VIKWPPNGCKIELVSPLAGDKTSTHKVSVKAEFYTA
jgi:hypothetical protein